MTSFQQSVEPFWPGLFVKALDNVIRSFANNIRAGEPAQQLPPHQQEVLLSLPSLPQLRRRKWEEKEESEECDDDMNFGLFD